MAELSAYIEAPYQGVSQAPPQVRLPTQASVINNALLAIPAGAKKRPPFDYLGMLTDQRAAKEAIFEVIERPTGNLLLHIYYDFNPGGGSKRVLNLFKASDLTPVPVTVTDEAQAYLDRNHTSGASPHSELRVLTVADYTFITNRQCVVEKATDPPEDSPARPYEGMIWIRQSGYGRTYVVNIETLGGTALASVSYTTPNGADDGDAGWVDTDKIAELLMTGTGAIPTSAALSGGLAAGCTAHGIVFSRIGSVLYFSRVKDETQDLDDFNIVVTDGQGGSAMVAVKDSVQRFSDLPQKVPSDGFTVRIAQESGSDNDDFFVHYRFTAGSATGIWEECIEPGSVIGLTGQTMPVGLTMDPDTGLWTCDKLPWGHRLVGNEKLSPDPDFVGQQVEDLTFWRGRLAVVSGEGVTLSAADDPFRFYPSTLSAVLDDDPVGLLSPYPSISTLRYALPFEDKLVLFGDICQLQVTSTGVVTPNTTRIDLMSSYQFDNNLRPQASHEKVYFASPKGTGATAIYELNDIAGPVVSKVSAEDMVTAVPRYLPPTLNVAASCPVEYLIAYTQAKDTDTLYIHLFRHADGQRVQNCWSTWTVPEGWSIGGAVFVNTTLYLYVYDGARAHVVSLDVAPNQLDEGGSILTYLDFRMTEDKCAVTYSDLHNETSFVLPYEPPDSSTLEVTCRTVDGGNGHPEGERGQAVYKNGTEIRVKGDWRDTPCWVGFKYVYHVRLSTIYALGQDQRPLRSGRLSIRRAVFDLDETGYFRVEVTAKGRETRQYAYEGYRYNDPNSVLNETPSGNPTRFSVPIGTENEQLTVQLYNDSPFGCSLLGYEWRGELNTKATRIS